MDSNTSSINNRVIYANASSLSSIISDNFHENCPSDNQIMYSMILSHSSHICPHSECSHIRSIFIINIIQPLTALNYCPAQITRVDPIVYTYNLQPLFYHVTDPVLTIPNHHNHQKQQHHHIPGLKNRLIVSRGDLPRKHCLIRTYNIAIELNSIPFRSSKPPPPLENKIAPRSRLHIKMHQFYFPFKSSPGESSTKASTPFLLLSTHSPGILYPPHEPKSIYILPVSGNTISSQQQR